MHAPETIEGWQAWDVFERSQGQVRAVGHMVAGLDFNAVLMMADSLGYDLQAMAELIPALESGLLTGIREQAQTAVD